MKSSYKQAVSSSSLTPTGYYRYNTENCKITKVVRFDTAYLAFIMRNVGYLDMCGSPAITFSDIRIKYLYDILGWNINISHTKTYAQFITAVMALTDTQLNTYCSYDPLVGNMFSPMGVINNLNPACYAYFQRVHGTLAIAYAEGNTTCALQSSIYNAIGFTSYYALNAYFPKLTMTFNHSVYASAFVVTMSTTIIDSMLYYFNLACRLGSLMFTSSAIDKNGNKLRSNIDYIGILYTRSFKKIKKSPLTYVQDKNYSYAGQVFSSLHYSMIGSEIADLEVYKQNKDLNMGHYFAPKDAKALKLTSTGNPSSAVGIVGINFDMPFTLTFDKSTTTSLMGPGDFLTPILSNIFNLKHLLYPTNVGDPIFRYNNANFNANVQVGLLPGYDFTASANLFALSDEIELIAVLRNPLERSRIWAIGSYLDPFYGKYLFNDYVHSKKVSASPINDLQDGNIHAGFVNEVITSTYASLLMPITDTTIRTILTSPFRSLPFANRP